MEALKLEQQNDPLAFINWIVSARGRVARSWRRYIGDQCALKGHRVIMLVMWSIGCALDDRERGRGDLGWSRIYSLLRTLDQVVIDRGVWMRGWPLMHLEEEPPASCVREPTVGLMPNPTSRLLDPKAAAICQTWHRELKAMEGDVAKMNPPEEEKSARAKARARTRANRKQNPDGDGAPSPKKTPKKQ